MAQSIFFKYEIRVRAIVLSVIDDLRSLKTFLYLTGFYAIFNEVKIFKILLVFYNDSR